MQIANRPGTDRDGSVVVMEGFLLNSFQKQVEECWREKASLSDVDSLEEISHLVAQ